MGSGNTKSKPAKSKNRELNKKNLEFLTSQTKLSPDEIKSIFNKFHQNNPNGLLDKKEFIKIYSQIRPEPEELLNEISAFVFHCFDRDKDNNITFNEFLLGYAVTSRGDLSNKLSFVFDMYDLDGNGYLDTNEIRMVLNGMLSMLGADRNSQDVHALAAQCMKDLDTSRDNKVSKEEFVKGLSVNYSIRSMMSPFN